MRGIRGGGREGERQETTATGDCRNSPRPGDSEMLRTRPFTSKTQAGYFQMDDKSSSFSDSQKLLAMHKSLRLGSCGTLQEPTPPTTLPPHSFLHILHILPSLTPAKLTMRNVSFSLQRATNQRKATKNEILTRNFECGGRRQPAPCLSL